MTDVRTRSWVTVLSGSEVRRFLCTLVSFARCGPIRPSLFLSQRLESIYISLAILFEFFLRQTVVAAAMAGQRQGHRSLWPSGLVPDLQSARHRVRRPNTPTWAAQTEFYFSPAYRFNRAQPWNHPSLWARPKPQPTTERATLQRPPPLLTTAKTTHVSPLQLLLVARLRAGELTTTFHCSSRRPTTISTRHDHIEASQHRILVINCPFQLNTERFPGRVLHPFSLQPASSFSTSRAKFDEPAYPHPRPRTHYGPSDTQPPISKLAPLPSRS